jgi:hypothetical protein
MERKMSKSEAGRQARAMVVMQREADTWACRPYTRWTVGVVGADGTLDAGPRRGLAWIEALTARNELVAYWARVILSGEEVAYV